jgi:hypothetical protein
MEEALDIFEARRHNRRRRSCESLLGKNRLFDPNDNKRERRLINHARRGVLLPSDVSP